MAGIEALKSTIKFLIAAASKLATADANHNGRIDWMEGLNLIMSVGFKLPGIINDIPEIKLEWKDLTPDEAKELAEWFAQEFDLPDTDHDKLQNIIKRITTGLVDNYLLYLDIKALFAA
jgi:hypothetical protein